MRYPLPSLALALCLVTAPAGAMPDPADGARYQTERVDIIGQVERPQTLDVAALRRLPSVTLAEVAITGHDGRVLRKSGPLTGVKLVTLLDAARLKLATPGDVKKMAIVVAASDGYKAVFSWNELFNSPAGNGVVLAYAREGRPIGEEEGRLMLVSAGDTRTGPRHVRWVKRIEVLKITD